MAQDRGTAGPVQARTFAFDIQVQDLNGALLKFASQADLQIFYDVAQVRGLKSAALKANLPRAQALDILLSGSGLRWRFIGANAVALEATRSSSTGEADLPEITVLGEAALGPVSGYVSHRSATATKTDTPLLETPQSISVVTRAQAEAQGAQSLSQALRYTAGVAPEARGTNSRYDMLYLRGFGSATDPTAYLDGLSFQRGAGYAFPQMETWGVERIEVLKGPSSMLYGAAIPGGLVNMVSKRPLENAAHEVELTYGSDNRKQAAFDFSGPLDRDGKYLYRLVGLVRDADTQVDYTKERRIFIAPSFTWKPVEGTSVTVLASYQHDPEGGYYGVLPTVGTLWKSSAGQIARNFYEGDPDFAEFDREQRTIGYEVTHDFGGGWSLRQNLRYMDLDVATQDLSTLSLSSDNHTIQRYALKDRESLSGLTSDLQLLGKFHTGAAEHTAIFGFDYQHLNWDQQQWMGYPPSYGGTVPSIDYLNPSYGLSTPVTLTAVTDQHQTLEQKGLYAQDQVKIGRLSLLGGMRYDDVSIDTRNRLTGTTQSLKDHAFSGRAGAIYELADGIAPYLSYSTSFRPLTGTDYKGDGFKPTTAKQYEVGVKYQPQGFDGLFTLAYFDMTQKNVVNTISATQRYQSGKVRSRGLEFEAKSALTDNLNLISALTYSHARVVESVGHDVGDAPINVPDWMASLWLDYSLHSGPLDGSTFGLGLRYIGSSIGGYSPNAYSASAVALDVPGYTLVDASARYDLGRYDTRFEGASVRLTVNNLFDREYVTCNANNFCNYGYGRSWALALGYKW